MPGLKIYLKRDGLLLLGSLVLAVLVWNYVNDELTETRTVEARLTLTEPEGATIVSGAVSTVKVVLRGPRGRMATLDPKAVVAAYRIPEGARGEVPVPLTEKNFALPEGVKIAELPEGFSVVVERLVPKRVPVRVRYVGEPAAGYEVRGAPSTDPADVEVYGRQEAVEKLGFIHTEEIDIAGRRERFSGRVRLAPAEAGVYCSERVTVTIDVGVARVPRDVSGIEVKVLVPAGFDRRVRLESPTIAVRLLGEPQRVTGVDPASILAMVDVTSLARAKAGTYELPVTLQMPPGLAMAPGAAVPKVMVLLGK